MCRTPCSIRYISKIYCCQYNYYYKYINFILLFSCIRFAARHCVLSEVHILNKRPPSMYLQQYTTGGLHFIVSSLRLRPRPVMVDYMLLQTLELQPLKVLLVKMIRRSAKLACQLRLPVLLDYIIYLSCSEALYHLLESLL